MTPADETRTVTIVWPQFRTCEVHRLQDELGLPHCQTVNGFQTVRADGRLYGRISEYARKGLLRIYSPKTIEV